MIFGRLPFIALFGISLIPPAAVATASVPVGARVTFYATADGTPAPTFQWKKDGANLIGATAATFVISSATPADSGTYRVTASNVAGTADSADEIFVVGGDPNAPLAGPAFTLQPVASLNVGAGGSATLSAAASGTPAPTYQWLKNERVIAGATQSTFNLSGATTADEGYYEVVASNSEGTVRSRACLVVVNAPTAPMTVPPTFILQPVASLSLGTGESATLSAAALGSPAPTYQWLKNERVIPGATQPTLTLSNATTADEGYYEVVAANSEGTVRSRACLVAVSASMDAPAFSLQPVAALSVGADGDGTLPAGTATANPDLASRIVYLSLQSWAGSGAEGQIVGFVVSGSSYKSVLLRGVGATLGTFGVADALHDPMLSLYGGSVLTASNDDWSKAINAAEVAETGARLGAFSLPESGADSAIVTTLEPGAYTLQLNGKSSSAGVALAEIYDAEPGHSARLVNMSARTRVGAGVVAPQIGFVISGTTPKQVMIRAIGPALTAFGVTDALADPELKIFRGDVLLDANDDWSGDPMLSETFARIGAFALGDEKSRDAVLFLTLLPGAYTVVVSGADTSAGIVLVEVYDVP